MKNCLYSSSSKLAFFFSLLLLTACGKVVSKYNKSTINGVKLAFDTPGTIDLTNISAYTISGECVNEAGDVIVNVGNPSIVSQTLACTDNRFSGVFNLSSGSLLPGNIELSANQTLISISSASYAFINLGATITTPATGSYLNNASQTVTGICLTGATMILSGDIVGAPLTTTCNSSAYSRSITLTPAEGPKVITVTQDDLDGNTNVTHSNVVYDITPPTIAISTTALYTTGLNPLPITATFSEPVTGFTAADVTVTNGTVASITGGPAVYTVNVTPGATGHVTVQISDHTVVDLANNDNLTGSNLIDVIYVHNLIPNTFISKWVIPANNTNVTLPLFEFMGDGVYNFTVDWGDGSPITTVSDVNDADKHHTYATSGEYLVVIKGQITNWGYLTWDMEYPCYIREVLRFGRMGWNRLINGFRNCTQLETFYALNGSTEFLYLFNVNNMFMDAVNLENINTSVWNTSTLIITSGMFRNATKVNPNVSSWDTSKVFDMRGMFEGATSANPDVSSWNTSLVTNFSNMFNGATDANPNVSNWNFGAITTGVDMFANSGISNTNYSGFLLRANATGPNNIPLGNIPAQYQPGAAAARTNLLGPKNWTFTDGGAE